jgi:hypothetical protein
VIAVIAHIAVIGRDWVECILLLRPAPWGFFAKGVRAYNSFGRADQQRSANQLR